MKQSGVNVGRSLRLVAKVKSDDFLGPFHLLNWERLQITKMKDCGVFVNDVRILKRSSGTLAIAAFIAISRDLIPCIVGKFSHRISCRMPSGRPSKIAYWGRLWRPGSETCGIV